MTDKERTLVCNLRLQGKMPMEISRITGIPFNTVKSYFRRHNNKLPKQIHCLNCGKPITTIKHHKGKKFCDDRCRMAYWNSHQELINKQAYYHLNCKYCGKEFISYGNRNRKFCRRECYKESLKKN